MLKHWSLYYSRTAATATGASFVVVELLAFAATTPLSMMSSRAFTFCFDCPSSAAFDLEYVTFAFLQQLQQTEVSHDNLVVGSDSVTFTCFSWQAFGL